MKLTNIQSKAIVLVIIASASTSMAQSTAAPDTTYWTKGAKTSLTFTQTTLDQTLHSLTLLWKVVRGKLGSR